jgi:hypothetical protein
MAKEVTRLGVEDDPVFCALPVGPPGVAANECSDPAVPQKRLLVPQKHPVME